METKDILASIEETKALIRRVRTPGGARRYGQPIGSIIVPDAPVPGARRKRSKRTTSTLPPLDTVNPSSHGVYEGYRPKDRASAPLAKNIVTLAETTGSDPDERITVYRGVPKGAQTAITPGDFITTNRQLAKDYAGTGDVISAEVRKGDILDDAEEPEGEEYVYRPEQRQRGTVNDAQEHPLASKPAKPLDFRFNRNPKSSTAHVKDPKAYGRDVEPAGRYMTQRSGDFTPDGWESGTVHFERPLYLDATQDDYGAEDHWKRRLSAHYGGKKGKALSQALRNDGYDAIVTHDKYGVGETIDLTSFKPKEGRGGSERVSVLDAQVSPSPEVAEGSGEVVSVSAKPGDRDVYTPGQKYVKNDPLIAAEMDVDFLKNGTAKEARDRMVALGARVNVGATAAKNRQFMTALSEVTRILEQEFPGFVERHGNYYSMGAKGRTAAFNAMSSKDARGKDVNTPDHKNGIYAEDAWSEGARRSLTRSTINSTYTTFTSSSMSIGNSLDANMKRTAKNSAVSHMSMTDALETFRSKGLSDDQIWQLHVITHELGHAIGHTVAGRIGFGIGDQEDPDQEQRRWYTEYYANSRLKFLDEMGIVKWTGKEYVADSMIGQKEHDEWHYRFSPGVRPQSPKIPTSRASRATWEKYRVAKAQHQADVEEWRERRDRLAKEEAQAIANGEVKPPDMQATRDDAIMGYTISGKNLTAFIKAMGDAGYLEKDARFKGKDVYQYHDHAALRTMTSEYGSTNWFEIEAETWAAYMLNENVTEGVSRWGEQMHTMYQWWTDDDAEMRQNR